MEADRKAFLMKHFHADFGDPTKFDLVVNTALLGTLSSCAAIRAAVERSQPAAKLAATTR